MNPRRIVSRAALDEWLTAEILKVPGCENCALASKYIVGEPRKNNGCNWAGLTIRMGEGAVAQAVAKAAAAIEQQASLLFNLDTVAPGLRVEALSVQMSRRLLYTPVFHLDPDLINARPSLPEVGQLEKWREDGVILLNMSGVAYDEAQAGGDVPRASSAVPQVCTHEVRVDRKPLIASEDVILVEANNDGRRNDVQSACDPIERHAIPVASDGGSRSRPRGVLDRRDDLRRLGANVMSAPEAVAYVRRQIAKRDAVNAEIAEATGQALPDWTGRD